MPASYNSKAHCKVCQPCSSHAAFNRQYHHMPMQQAQASPMHPDDMDSLKASAAPYWLKMLVELATLVAARFADLLGPLMITNVDAAAILTVFNHKTSGRGRKAPPLQLPVPEHPAVLCFLRARAKPYPTRFFPECVSTRMIKDLVRKYVPHPKRPFSCYSARNAGIEHLGNHLPVSLVKETVGHQNLNTTKRYLRNSVTWSQRRSVSMIARMPRWSESAAQKTSAF